MGALSIPAELAKQHKAKEMFIVTPHVNFSFEYLSGFDNFIHELTGTIMPFIEKNYPVLTGRENTAIAGFSMGGRTALYIGYTKPELFGYNGAFSPAFGINSN